MTFDNEYLIVPLKLGKHNVEISVICEEYENKDNHTIEVEINEI